MNISIEPATPEELGYQFLASESDKQKTSAGSPREVGKVVWMPPGQLQAFLGTQYLEKEKARLRRVTASRIPGAVENGIPTVGFRSLTLDFGRNC